MIAVNDFTYTYPGATSPALHDVSLKIGAGEAVLIRGASGSGKTTFLYCLNGLIPHVFAGSFCGSVRLNGFAPTDVPMREIARTVGTVFQNPESQIFMMRVEDDVAFGCENLCLSREEIIRRRDESLHFMGLWDMRCRETFKLSGGYKQRLAVSSIYAMQPDIFLFDEPTTDLDSEGRKEIFRIIQNLKEKGKTIVLVEHQYEDYLPLMDKIIDMEGGRIAGNNIFSKKMPPLRRAAGLPAAPVISLQGVRFGYDRQTDVLNGIDVTINKGELVAFCGDNGSGKTTLLKMISGILRPGQGKIKILNIHKPDLESLVGRVGFLFQNPDEQLFAASVEEEIRFGSGCLRKNTDIDKYLEIAGLQAKRMNHPQTISRGQRQIDRKSVV